MLRGRQTAGEIRGRTERLCDFANLAAVETTLQSLMEHDCGPLVVKLPRQPGRKEARFAHLLCGELEPEDEDVPAVEASDRQIDSERIEALILAPHAPDTKSVEGRLVWLRRRVPRAS